MNCFILGWVTQAMVSIITVLLGPVIAQGRVLQLSIAGHVFPAHAGRSSLHVGADLHLHSDSFHRAYTHLSADSGACWSPTCFSLL